MSIEIEALEHVYNKGTPFEHVALKGIDLTIPEGKVTAIIGQTGSGKSTLVQHLNGLLMPTGGFLDICGYHIQPLLKIKDIKELRKKVGLVFQFPEYQLFEETIEKDIAFGPKNFGTSEEEANALVRKVLPLVGLDESYLDRSPFEPTAGLDPQGATEMMSLFMKLNCEMNKTVLLVTHDMDHVMNYCDHVIVLDHGKLKHESDVQTFFQHPDWMLNIGINPPALIRLKMQLKEKGFDIPDSILTLDELVKCVAGQVSADE